MPDYQLQCDLSDGEVQSLTDTMNGDRWRVRWSGTVWLVPKELVDLPTDVLLGSTDAFDLCPDPILSVGWQYEKSSPILACALREGEVMIKDSTLRVRGLLVDVFDLRLKTEDYFGQFTMRHNSIDTAVRRLMPDIPPRGGSL